MTAREIAREGVAGALLLAVAAGIPAFVGAVEARRARAPEGTVVIRLTGVMHDGVWTEDEVTAANYWQGGFRRARLSVPEGTRVRLRLQSADVTHGFYLPALHLGPVEVEPGKERVLEFVAAPAGVHRFYCTTVCGECHFFMQGTLEVTAPGAAPAAGGPEDEPCPHLSATEIPASGIARGKALFRALGCITCHGPGGEGGVPNPNARGLSVPALLKIADTIVRSEAEQKRLLELVEAGTPPETTSETWAKDYLQVKKKVREGAVPEREDPAGPAPPLRMPSWLALGLPDADIDALLGYLVSLFPPGAWEDWDEPEGGRPPEPPRAGPPGKER